MSFLTEYWHVFAFYIVISLLIYLNRSRFEFQGIVALLKTKLGLKFMQETGERHPRLWHHLGLLSITFGYAGMLFITGYIFFGLYQVLFVPGAPPVLTPVIPGANIPGGMHFPLGYTLIALFIAVVVHEAAHGIWASAYRIKIKSSGFALFGPLPGAFVEPDEKVMFKRPARQQLAMFAAGPFSNVVLALVMFGALLGLGALSNTLVTANGAHVTTVQDGFPAAQAGIPSGAVITRFDETPILTHLDLSAAIQSRSPQDTVVITADDTEYTLTLAQSPDEEGRAYLGVAGLETVTVLKNPSMGWLQWIIGVLFTVAQWTVILSFGVGLANLLPVGPIDGGRMFLIALQKVFDKKRAEKIFVRWSYLLFAVIIVVLLIPIFRAIF